MKFVDKSLIKDLVEKAKESPRKRAHHNLHPELDDPVQRLCVAANEGAYIRPHRHAEPYKWEMFIIVQGTASILFFDDTGVVTERRELDAYAGGFVVEIPPQTWHTLVITSPETVLMEIKPGPYSPLDDKDFASWAPEEHSSDAAHFENKLRTVKIGKGVA